MNGGVYKITLNGRLYVGSARRFTERWQAHLRDLRSGKHHSRFLQASFNKHGAGAMSFEVLEVVRDKALLLIREQAWLDALRPFDGGYNSCPTAGSRAGTKLTEEQRARLSQAHKGKIFSAETRERLSTALRGHTVSAETRAKIAAANNRRPPMPDSERARISAMHAGKPKSPEHRAKLAALAVGRRHSPERRAKISAAQLGKKRGPHSAEHKRKLSESHRRRFAALQAGSMS